MTCNDFKTMSLRSRYRGLGVLLKDAYRLVADMLLLFLIVYLCYSCHFLY